MSAATPLASDGTTQRRILLTIVVSALGYFVDLFDFVLFGVYRIQSLTDIGVPGETQLKMGMSLLSTQMGGMIVGGMVWGLIADKRGRTSVLMASILTYSIANIANGFITSVDQYFICRFLAGFGLAGEIGAAVTLIAEVIGKERRELGSALLFGIGFIGAIVGCLTALVLQWRTAYFVGGGMGLALLVMRATLTESGLFKGLAQTNVRRGGLNIFFGKATRKRFWTGVLVGVPTYFGALISAYIPEYARELGTVGTITSGQGIMYGYIGVAIGAVSAAMLSRKLRSRKRVILLFVICGILVNLVIFFTRGLPASVLCGLLVAGGFCSGYTALYITAAAEAFGTNMRATAATMIPGMVRAMTIPMNVATTLLSPSIGLINGSLLIQVVVGTLALFALFHLQETFGKDLNYVEA